MKNKIILLGCALLACITCFGAALPNAYKDNVEIVSVSASPAAYGVVKTINHNANTLRVSEDASSIHYVAADYDLDFSALPVYSFAPVSHRVLPGDTMWKIAVRYEIGLAELIKANPQIKNAAMIYVGQIINIPEGAPLKTLEDEVVRLVNVERSRNGLQLLKSNWQASRVARIKSEDMIRNRYFSHTSPVYGSPFKMMEDYGLRFSAAGENIAYGQRTAQEVMNAWMNSPGHRANILSRAFTEIGVGAAKAANGTLYWTQMFLKPLG